MQNLVTAVEVVKQFCDVIEPAVIHVGLIALALIHFTRFLRKSI